MVDVTTNDDYRVGAGAGDIRLAVTIGEGQFGTSRAKLDGSELATGSGPFSVKVGKRSEVKGKTLFVRTVVNDVNSLTNRMSVTYRLTGGTEPAKIVAKGTVTQEGDVLIFDANISLI
jgi:hypothetical protein